MTQATNNRILLRTLAFCVAVAGIGATPAMAYDRRSAFERDQQIRHEMQQQNQRLEMQMRRDMQQLRRDIQMQQDFNRSY